MLQRLLSLTLLRWIALGQHDKGPLELTWTAPEQCPTSSEVRERALQLVGAAAIGTKTVIATAVVDESEPRRYRLTLNISTSGEAVRSRVIEAQDCEKLSHVAALILAIVVDPDVLTRVDAGDLDLSSKGASEDSVPAQRPAPVAARKADPASQTGRSASRSEPTAEPPTSGSVLPPSVQRKARATRANSWQLALHAEGGATFGVLPGASGVVGGAADLSGRLWRVELGGLYSTPSSTTASAGEPVGGRFALWSIVARGCGVPEAGPLSFPVCATFAAGAMNGRGRGELQPARQDRAPWVGLGGGVAMIWRPKALGGWLGFMVRAEALASLVRPRFDSSRRTIYTGGFGTGRFTIGLEGVLRRARPR